MRRTAIWLSRGASPPASGRARLSGRRNVSAYGTSEYEQLDIFRTPAANARINLFVHGGAWRRNKAADYALQAEVFVRAGAHAVIIDFINVDQANGDLMPMYEQVCRAIAWTWHNAESFGGDRDRFYLSAHSSGSHLAGCALTLGWREHGLPENFCKGALLASGMYDLAPVRLSKRSAYVKFTDAMVEKLSSQRHLDGLHTPLVVAHGTARRRNSSARPAIRRRGEGRRQAGRTCDSRPTTISNCWRPSPILTAFSAARR